MKTLLKIIGIAVAILLGALALGAVVIYARSESLANQTFKVPTEKVAIPTDAASIQEGQRLANIRGCTGCHTPDLGGEINFFDNPLATLSSANITRGGRTATYTDDDWVRTLRHGVDPKGRGLWVMPAHELVGLSDADLGKIIAFAKQVPPVTRDANKRSAGVLGRFLLATGQLPAEALVPAIGINHTAPRPPVPAVGATADYGAYIAPVCWGCHNPNLSGGPGPGDAPGGPVPANLTEIVKGYSEAQFMEMLRTGKNAAGRQIPPNVMPPLGAPMTETELKALYMYLHSLPVRPTGM